MSQQAKPFGLSVKAVVLNPEKQCLAIRRSRQCKTDPGLWDLPGGKCDPGESMEAALRREVTEETGLEVRLTHVAGSAQWEMPEVMVALLLLEAECDGGEVRLSDEHDEYQWVKPEQLNELTFPESFREVLRDYVKSAKTRHAPPPLGADAYRAQIEQYRRKQPRYKELAETLIRVLQKATGQLGIYAIVQARAKAVASVAEKIQRPGKDYVDPMREMTDLCGARVIAHTLSEVAAVCRFIEEHFQIYWKDSGDKLEDLAAMEFGYLSQHYIVSFRPGVFPTDEVPESLLGEQLQAEIQVRTILQHAWAAISHELSYKNRFKLPRLWQREFARLAAALEEADRDFERISAGLQQYASSYGAYYSDERLRQEIDRHAIILEVDPRNADIAHELAKMAMSLEDWPRAVEVLGPFTDGGSAPLLRDLGISLCKLHRKQPSREKFREGQKLIERATELDPTNVDAFASLAGTWRTRAAAETDPEGKKKCHKQAKRLYRQAYEIDPGDPYPLGNYVEYEAADHPKLDIGSMFRPSLQAASKRCLAQIEVGVNMPWAWFDLGKFQLLLGEPHDALGYYARGIDNSTAPFFLDSALGSFATLENVRDRLPGFDWSPTFLRLAKAIRFTEQDAAVLPPSPAAEPLRAPVVIVAGYCGEDASEAHRAALIESFGDFRGTILSGGIAAGISEVVGQVQATYPDALHTIGYVPRELPEGVELDRCYREHRSSHGTDFSPTEPLQYWADLLASDIAADQIRLVAIGGGRITADECQMALALRVPVAVIETGGSQVRHVLNELGWSDHPLCRSLPMEAGALRDFLRC